MKAETAEDIFRRTVAKTWSLEGPTKRSIMAFAKEIADKAWEAGANHDFNVNCGIMTPSKEDFMKELFNPEA